MINPIENIASIFMEALSENFGRNLLIQKNSLLPKLNYRYVAFTFPVTSQTTGQQPYSE